jgi:hypothetical protein
LRGCARTEHRVLRGGSFNNNQNNARCAYRNRNNPNNRNNNNGFRVVLATLSASLARNITRPLVGLVVEAWNKS